MTRTPSVLTRRHRLAALLVPLLLIAGACTGGSSDVASAQSNKRDSSSTASSGALDWGTCDSQAGSLSAMQCATLAAPIDRNNPDSGSIDLELARVPATGSPNQRIGSLLFNPGGPGGSGIEFLASAAMMVPEELAQQFDLVSWDPRGVGESSPVHCLSDDQKDKQIEGDLSPDDPAEMDRSIKDQKSVLDGCKKNNPDLIDHMSTADVAGDLEEIRQALGDQKLNYVGFSYGTAIGATYATMFPSEVRAMVLDGSVSPTATDLEQTITQAEGFENTFDNFVSTCDADAQCALQGHTEQSVADVRSMLDDDPLVVDTASGKRELTRDLFDVGLATALYDTSVWSPLARAIDDIEKTLTAGIQLEPDGGSTSSSTSGGGMILALADRQFGRNPDGTWDNSSDAQVMVNCADADDRPTTEEGIKEGEKVAEAAPLFGEFLKTGPLSCVNWPEPANPVPEWTAAGAPPILVVGTVGDPATPYKWSEQMNKALGGSVLLTYEGDGHTAFMRGGPCIDNAVVAYLVDLELPMAGTSCPAQSQSSDSTLGGMRDQLIDELKGAGLSESVATCIADQLEESMGTTGLEDLLLGGDPNELTNKITEIAQKCMAGN